LRRTLLISYRTSRYSACTNAPLTPPSRYFNQPLADWRSTIFGVLSFGHPSRSGHGVHLRLQEKMRGRNEKRHRCVVSVDLGGSGFRPNPRSFEMDVSKPRRFRRFCIPGRNGVWKSGLPPYSSVRAGHADRLKTRRRGARSCEHYRIFAQARGRYCDGLCNGSHATALFRANCDSIRFRSAFQLRERAACVRGSS
jgi:hypothetical protein